MNKYSINRPRHSGWLRQRAVQFGLALGLSFSFQVAAAADLASSKQPARVQSQRIAPGIVPAGLDAKSWESLQLVAGFEAKLKPATDGPYYNELGYSVAVDGDTVVIGSLDSVFEIGTTRPQYTGSVYVYVRSGAGWVQQTRINEGGQYPESFGLAVAVSGDTLLIGAPNAILQGFSGDGSVSVYTRSGGVWSLSTKLIPSDRQDDAQFGISVALSGDTAVVGAQGFDIGSSLNRGAAYVFTRNGGSWNQQARLTASNGQPQDGFGRRLALSGDTVLIGAPFYNAQQGTAYVFVRNGSTWSQQAQLLAPNGASVDYFAEALALDGNTAVIGAPYHDVFGGAANLGAAYVFTRENGFWGLQQALSPDDGAANDYFGYSVAVAGNTAIVGSVRNDFFDHVDQGAVYAYARSGLEWTQQTKIIDGLTGTSNAQFGSAVALNGETAVIGAHLDGNLDHQGAGFIYNVAAPPPSLSVNDVSITEGNSGTRNLVFTISLSEPASVPVTVVGATADGFSVSGSDYKASSATYTFAPGQTSVTAKVKVFGDTIPEANELFLFNLSNPTGGAVIGDDQGFGFIVNDDDGTPLTPTLSIGDAAVTEGSRGTTTSAVFTVSLSPAASVPVTVSVNTTDGSATASGDFKALSQSLTFNPGQTSKTVKVSVKGDATVEPNETFFVNLSNPTSAVIGNALGIGSILNDD